MFFPKHIIDNMWNLNLVDKNAVCSTLFYAANWFIELINSFSTKHDIEVKRMVRLQQLLDLQKTMISPLAGTKWATAGTGPRLTKRYRRRWRRS